MNTIAANDVKRRGIGCIDPMLQEGPVHIIKNNKLSYVVLSEESYQELLHDTSEARLAASTADLEAGRIRSGSAKELMVELED